MRSPALALALAAAIATSAACTSEAFEPTTTPTSPTLALGYGVHDTPSPVLAFLHAQGVQWVRLTYYYQTVDDSVWTAALATQLADLHANGQHVLLVVHSTPWNDVDGDGIPHAVANLLRTHAGQIDAVELYNEENVGVAYWKPVLPGASDSARGVAYAARYAAMHDTVAALIPLLHVPVVTGGTAGDPSAFLLGMRSAGAHPDIVAVHAYGFPPAAEMDEYVRQSRVVFPGVPVWVTEVASEGGRTDSTTLALDIGGILAWADLHPDVRLFWTAVHGSEDGILNDTTFVPRPGTRALLMRGPFQ